jgi:hypothetical protein
VRAELLQMPAEEYHDDPAVSNSSLKVFAESRRRYYLQFVVKQLEQESTPSMDLGTVAHAAVLEPHIISDVCREIPDAVLSASGARAGKKWEEFVAANEGKILLKRKDLATVRGMFEAVYKHSAARKLLLAAGSCEQVIKWNCALTSLPRRSRLDKIIDGWGFLDVKTTNSVKPHLFAKTCADYRYAQQIAFYMDAYRAVHGGEEPNAVLVAVETKAPYPVRVYQLDQETIDRAAADNDKLLRHLAWCKEHDDWSDDGEDDIQILKLPNWATGGVE